MRAEADQLGEIERLRSELQELHASRLRLALAADAERSSIEGSLHDGVLQGLAGLAAGLELAAGSVEEDPAAATRLLVEMRADLRLAMKETRELAHRIYPPLLDAGGLGPALRFVAASADVPIRIDVAAAKDRPKEIAAAVYFCCRDVIDRVAAGTPTSVSVGQAEGVLTCHIVTECDVDVPGTLADRVAALGGGLSVRREAGRTEVVGSFPVPG